MRILERVQAGDRVCFVERLEFQDKTQDHPLVQHLAGRDFSSLFWQEGCGKD